MIVPSGVGTSRSVNGARPASSAQSVAPNAYTSSETPLSVFSNASGGL
jgi:hypothetical protein